MSDYREPKLQIIQDFEAALAGGAAPLYACYIGPNYELHRFTEEDEQAEIGPYDRTASSSVFAWPDKIAGGIIDVDNASIWIEDALVLYSEDPNYEVLEDNSNQIRNDGLIFATNSAADRSSEFGDRDVAVGDIAKVTYVDESSAQVVLETEVIGLLADTVAGTTDPDNVRLVGFGDTEAGASESTTLAPPSRFNTGYDITNYDGLADGYPLDTYSIRIVSLGFSGTGGLDGTILNITSAGGDTEITATLGSTDYPFVATASSAAPGPSSGCPDGVYEVPLGARGAILQICDSGDATSPSVGTIWEVTVSQDYTEVDVTNAAEFDTAGPYTGDKNTQYILTITTGGTVGTDDLIINIKTNNGADTEETLTIPASDFPPASVDYAVGNKGMVLTFVSGTQWNTGDIVTFDVLGESEGEIHTLILRDPVGATAAVSFEADLFVKDTFEFPSEYYTLTGDDITISGSALLITDLLGSPAVPLEIHDGTLYADYRELRTENCNELRSLDRVTQVDDVLGPAVTDNPLSKAVFHGISESGGVAVFYMAICTDDYDGYEQALDILTENDDVYQLHCSTHDQAVKDLMRSHVLERSDQLNNQWRIAWVTNDQPLIKPIYTELANGDDILATVTEFTAGQIRLVEATNALFASNGVKGGDKFRINFSEDASGNVTYDEYTVDRVEDEDTLILLESLPGAITVPVQIEIHREQDNDEYAASLAGDAVQYNTRRVYDVWADNPVEDDGTAMDLLYVAAALAGQRSGVPPHAPLSQVSLTSISLDPQLKMSRTQMNTIAAGGVWIVTKDFDGRVFTRHQVSTVNDPADLNSREQSVTTNLDHISRDFLANTNDLFGQGNVSPEMVSLIRQRINSLIESISNRPYSAKIGPQMLGAEIIGLRIDEVLKDTIIVEIDPALPVPLNELTIFFRVGATT